MNSIILGLFLLTGPQADSATPSDVAPEFQLSEVLSSKEYRDYQRKAKYKDRVNVYRKALDRHAVIIRSLTRQNRTEDVFEALQRVRSLVHYIGAEKTDNPDDLRSKQVKQLEIRIRRLLETLKDLQASVPSNYQLEFEKTSQALETLRSELLRRMFGQTVMTREEGEEVLGLPPPDVTAEAPVDLHYFRSPPGTAVSLVVNLPSSDRFTEEEFTKIQDNQQLVKRVEVFLEIAENRLKEIDRRMENKPWEDKEPNPLEFFTLSDMIHAYERAIKGIMINIDEKARYKLAEKKDIRKALEKLNEKIVDFIPRLEKLRQYSIEKKDRELFEVLRQALASSEQARKGSQLGLGAPVK